MIKGWSKKKWESRHQPILIIVLTPEILLIRTHYNDAGYGCNMPISREKHGHRIIVCPEASTPHCIALSCRGEARLPLGEPWPANTKAGFRTHIAREIKGSFSAKNRPSINYSNSNTFPIKLRHSPKPLIQLQQAKTIALEDLLSWNQPLLAENLLRI